MLSSQCNTILRLLTIVVMLFLLQGYAHVHYYVKPYPDYSCDYDHCKTLSWYSLHNDVFHNRSGNITLTFLPGIHSISESLEITRVNVLILIGRSAQTTHLQCTGQVYFRFTDVFILEINNLTVSNCGHMTASPLEAMVIHARDIHKMLINNLYALANNYTSTISARRVSIMVVSNSSFEGNEALSFQGGALSVIETSNLEIRECIFTNNHYRGAVFVDDTHNITISNSQFVNNSAFILDCHNDACNFGGAISILGLVEETYITRVTLAGNNRFENNVALISGGGLYAERLLALNVSVDTMFCNNTAHFRGGAVAVRDGLIVTISDSNFTNNKGGNIGGAVSISSVLDITLKNIMFMQNALSSQGANKHASGGGGIAIIGSRYSRYTSVTIEGYMLFKDNYAEGMGGGMLAQLVTFNITTQSCTFEENGAVVRGGALAIQAAKTVRIQRCMFRANQCWQDAGALSLVLVESVVLTDVHFFKNKANNRHAGALLVGDRVTQSTIVFKGITLFQDNYAKENGGAFNAKNSLVEFQGTVKFCNNYALGGGGIAVNNASLFFRNNLTMENNVGNKSTGAIYSAVSRLHFEGNTTAFVNNTGRLHGGAIFGLNTSCNFSGATLRFMNNTAFRSGGAIGGYGIHFNVNVKEIYFLYNAAQTGGIMHAGQLLGDIWPNAIEIRCTGTMYTDYNTATYYGGAFSFYHAQVLFQGKIVGFGNNAKDNGGWLYSFESTVTMFGTMRFENNSALAGGVFSAEKSTFVFQAKLMEFRRNTASKVGGVLYLDLSNTHLFSNSLFDGNSATEGGAIHIDGNSQIHIYKDTIVNFIHNYAERGGSIYVNDFVNVKTCYFDTRCFFEHNEFLFEQDPNLLSKQLFFYNNSAKASGSVLFGGLLDRCKISGLLTIEREYIGRDVWFLISNSTQHDVSSFPIRMCLCINNTHNCTRQTQLSKIRGQLINISAVVVDQSENPIASMAIRAQFPQDSRGDLGERQLIQTLPAKCSNLEYRVYSPDDNESIQVYSDDGPCRDLGISKLVFPIQLLPCPTGFELSQRNTTCICHTPLQRYTNTCDIDTQTIQRKGNFWFRYENTSLVLHRHCPFDYCKSSEQAVQVRVDDTNELCAHNRQGTLCGACTANLSLSLGSSKCSPCHKLRVVWTTILFALAGILLIAFLLVFRFTVAIGTINGLIFYANIVAVNKTVLFPSVQGNPLVIFIAWLNLDIGIETCYYNGMDTYGRTWLQFAFPLYVWALVGFIILISHYSTYAARIFGTNPVSVLATLFLLSYTKMLQTIIVVFSFTYIEYPETGRKRAVWLYDANIDYLKGKHIVLFTITLIFFIVFFVPYTLLLLFGQCLRKLPKKQGLRWTESTVFTSVMDAYHAPYNVKHRYWSGLMLLVRCVLFLAFSFNVLGDPGINLLAINTVMIIVIVPATYLKIYSKVALTLLELSFLINLAVLAGVTHQLQQSYNGKDTVTKISVTAVIVTFIGILVYHCYIQLKDTALWKRLKEKQIKSVSEQELNLVNSNEILATPKRIPTTTVVERPYLEPLIHQPEKNSI